MRVIRVRFHHVSIVFFVAVLLSTIAAGITRLELLESSCHEDGTLVITAKNTMDDPIFTNAITITARHADDDQSRSISGTWDREWIVYNSTPAYGVARFQSDAEALDDAGDYLLKVAYHGCGDDARCTITLRLESCPGQKIRCEEGGVAASSCIIRDNTLYQYVDVKRGFDIDVKKDLLFHFESSRRNLNGVHAFPSMNIEATKTGYLITLGLEEGETISSVGVRREACDEDAVMVACENPSADQVKATATIVDIPDDKNESISAEPEPAEMESSGHIGPITGAVAGIAKDESKKSAFSFGWILMILLPIVIILVYLLYVRNFRLRKLQ